jgi:hypothetical protein
MKSIISKWKPFVIHSALIVLLSAMFVGASARAPLAHADSSSFTRDISISGVSSFNSAPSSVSDPVFPEIAGVDDDQGETPFGGAIVDRSQDQGPGQGALASSSQKAKSNPELGASFDGLNHLQQRQANGGNQFSVEPPDQGLCAGHGFVMESVNDVLQVYSTTGTPLLNAGSAVDLNTFYGYPAAINRTTGARGPAVTDPSCYFDQPTQRWFQVALTLDTFSNGADTGSNHLDIAVSQTSDPTGQWTIYRLPVQDDGTNGTPNHNCAPGAGSVGATNPNACLGDYPHIGADANGFYITTNEFSFFGPGFRGSQVYALSKTALTSGAATVSVTQFDTAGAVNGNPGFTIWPASTPGNAYATDLGGTEYFMSSNASRTAHGTGVSTDLIVWAITNTHSLNNASPALTLNHTILSVNPYAIPPKADQKVGDHPLGECLNDNSMATPFGPGCWRFFFASGGPFHEVESLLDSNDSRMQQVVFANGKLWGALDTALTLDGVNKAGIAWFIVKPEVSASGVSGSVAKQGYLGLSHNNLTYPAIGVTQSGRGVMAFTVVGADHFPSPGYVSLDALAGAGDIHIIVDGAGPDDGFTSYTAFVGSPPRTRWGDYGAAAMDGQSIWISSEYIGPANGAPCTLSVYVSSGFSCGNSRTSLGNWDTRISQLKV